MQAERQERQRERDAAGQRDRIRERDTHTDRQTETEREWGDIKSFSRRENCSNHTLVAVFVSSMSTVHIDLPNCG